MDKLISKVNNNWLKLVRTNENYIHRVFFHIQNGTCINKVNSISVTVCLNKKWRNVKEKTFIKRTLKRVWKWIVVQCIFIHTWIQTIEMLGVNHIILFKCWTDKMSVYILKKKISRIELNNLKLIYLVIGVSDDPNCAKCDIRAVCIRLSNTSGVSCVCLPGFALSPSTGGCVLQGNIFLCYVRKFFFPLSSSGHLSKER